MVHEMKLFEGPFEMIKAGRKTVELRLFDEKRQRLRVGDNIIFTKTSDESQKLAVRVKALHIYASFEDLFSEISPQLCGNSIGQTVDEAAAGMKQYYSDSQISEYGVIGIGIEVVDLEEVLRRKAAIDRDEFYKYFPDGMK